MKFNGLLDKLNALIKPIVTSMNYELYFIEFKKENNENYLRVYIDSPDGIYLDDCEKVSRAISDILDEEDPIEFSYYLEVSSPGVFRQLHNEEHYKKFIGYAVKVKLKSLFMGKKEYLGELGSFTDDSITLKVNNESIKITRDNIKSVTLNGEL